MDLEWLETRLAEYPLTGCAFFDTRELVFSERVRHICENACERFDKSWSCPPAVGTLDECRARILSYRRGLLIAAAFEDDDIEAARSEHGRLTREILGIVRERDQSARALSAEACALCADCTWPDAPCRCPERMLPCVESHGILVTDLAERFGMPFMPDPGTVNLFSMVLFDD